MSSRRCDNCGQWRDRQNPEEHRCPPWARDDEPDGTEGTTQKPPEVGRRQRRVEHLDNGGKLLSAVGDPLTQEELLHLFDVDLEQVEVHKVNHWEQKPGRWLNQIEVHPIPEPGEVVPQPVSLEVESPSVGGEDGGDEGRFVAVHYGDMHIPYHDRRAVSILYQVIDRIGPDMVVDHGDLLDCREISDYARDPHNRVLLNEELHLAAEHCGNLEALAPDAEKRWYLGNHEDRKRRAVWELADDRRAGEILTLPGVKESLRFSNLVGVADRGWKVIPYGEHDAFFDQLVLKHGSVERKHAGQSARFEFENYGISGLSGHTHRVGSYFHRDYNGIKGWWEIGLLGQLDQGYNDKHANWQQGFAVVTWNEDCDYFDVEQVRIFDGTAFFRGERLVGDPADAPSAQTITRRAA